MVNQDEGRKQSKETYMIVGVTFLVLAFPFLLIVAVLHGNIAIRFVLLMVGACLLVIGTTFFLLAKLEKGERKNKK